MVMGQLLFHLFKNRKSLERESRNAKITYLYKCYSEGPCTAGSCDISPYVPPASSAACNCARSMHTCEVFQLLVKNKNKICSITLYNLRSLICWTGSSDSISVVLDSWRNQGTSVSLHHVWITQMTKAWVTRVRAQVSGEGVSAAASVVAQMTFERFLARVQFDVSEQVTLLSEGSTTLVALEWPLPYRRKKDNA